MFVGRLGKIGAMGAVSSSVEDTGPDETAPIFLGATVNGTTVTITYNETLDETSTPATSAFTVGGVTGGTSVSNVSVMGTTVTLTLSDPAVAGDTVTLSYTAPGVNPIQDESGNEAIDLVGEPVTNNTVELVAPEFQSAAVNGDTLVMTYNEDLDESSVPATTAFTVGGVTGGATVTNVAISGDEVTLTLSNDATIGDTVTLSYTAPGSNPIQDLAGNDAVNLTTEAVTNNTPDVTAPVFQSAAVNDTTLVLTYDENLDSGSTPATTAFTIGGVTGGTSVSNVSISGSEVTLTLSNGASNGDTVTVTYTVPGSNPLQDAAGNDCTALSSESVTNNTPAEANAPSDVSNLAYHWRADDVAGVDGADADLWEDRVGSVDLEQSVGSYTPTIEKSEINSQDAVYFTDANDHLEINNGTDVDYEISEAFSGVMIYRPDAIPTSRTYFMGKGDTNDGWSLESGPTGQTNRIMLRLQDITGANAIEVKTNAAVFTDTTVRMIGFTYDGSNTDGGIKLYVDGSSVTTAVETDTAVSSITNSNEFCVGALSTSATFGVEGMVPEICIWSKELSAAEMSQLYDNYFSSRYGV